MASSSDDEISMPQEERSKIGPENGSFAKCPKMMKFEWSNSYSNKALRMMSKMGYEKNKGLGKQGQGRLEPIKASHQEGRRGLGLHLENPSFSTEWDTTLEEIEIPEKIYWIENDVEDLKLISMKNLASWVVYGSRKEYIDDETRFCKPNILKSILHLKSAFDALNDNDIRRARARSNAFETIRTSIFLNRAAVKMANIDSMCDYMFTNPRNQNGDEILHNNDLLYFADICAGPGGFSEYILYKKLWEAKGFGFTLRGENDFKLDKFLAGSPETFDPYYGVNDDGNIFDPENQESFADYVFKQTESGVHFVMADGGFSVEGRENIQEILSKQLYLCQCLVALQILRENGHFVCKLFDIFTPFTIGLIYLMYKCFNKISICKPNTSRPANSERYLICKWKKSNTENVQRHMSEINKKMWDKRNLVLETDITELVCYDILAQDKKLMEYINKSNNQLGQRQIVSLKKIAAFCQNPLLKETRQSEYRQKCLELWNLPDKMRQTSEKKSADDLLLEILGKSWYDDKHFLRTQPAELKLKESLDQHIESIYDWYFVPIGRGETTQNICVFLCSSRRNLLRYTCTGKWELVDYHFEISPKSLFYGEIINEFTGEGRTQIRGIALHIIDGIMLGGKDIRRLKLQDRIKMCEKFARSLNKPCREGNQNKWAPIRCKQLFKLRDISKFFYQMRHYSLKDGNSRLGFRLSSNDGKSEKFFIPGGVLFFCEISHNFFSNKSKSRNVLYYFNKVDKQSHFIDCLPKDVQTILYASFRNSFSRRLQWKWTCIHQVDENITEDRRQPNILFRDDFCEFISHKI